MNKDFIYDSINDLLEIPFVPMFYRTEDKAAIFYVEMTLSSVEALKSVNKRITFPNGFKVRKLYILSTTVSCILSLYQLQLQ